MLVARVVVAKGGDHHSGQLLRLACGNPRTVFVMPRPNVNQFIILRGRGDLTQASEELAGPASRAPLVNLKHHSEEANRLLHREHRFVSFPVFLMKGSAFVPFTGGPSVSGGSSLIMPSHLGHVK